VDLVAHLVEVDLEAASEVEDSVAVEAVEAGSFHLSKNSIILNLYQTKKNSLDLLHYLK